MNAHTPKRFVFALAFALVLVVPQHSMAQADDRLRIAKADLAGVEAKIEAERKRWQDSMNTINRLTNNKRTPVQQGSQAYNLCSAASQIMEEVEKGAPKLTAEQARLKAVVQALSSTEAPNHGVVADKDARKGNSKGMESDNPQKEIPKPLDPEIAAKVEEITKAMIGTWTYTGQNFNVQGIATIWFRWIIKADGTMEEYTAQATADNWGKPEKKQWQVITDKYSNTGKRFYAFQIMGETAAAIFVQDSEVDYRMNNVNLRMVKKDAFPFSK